jgi:hypothetical protein
MDEHVAVVHVRAKGGDDRAHRIRHRAEMDRQVGALRDHVTCRVEHAAGIIARRLEDRRICGLRQDDAHLLGDLVEAVLDDLEGRRIGLRGHVVHLPVVLIKSVAPVRPVPCKSVRGTIVQCGFNARNVPNAAISARENRRALPALLG